MTLDSDTMYEIRRALEEYLPERAEITYDQIAILAVAGPRDPELPHTGCSWCRDESAPSVGLDSRRHICQGCSLRFYPNLLAAKHGKPIPAMAMVLADARRVLAAAGIEKAGEILEELERRASVRKKLPRGFLPGCDGCLEPFERCAWTASLPGVDLCDDCVRWAANAFFI